MANTGDTRSLGIAPIGSVGLIGLGSMGSAMAGNLISAGFELVVHNRSPAKAEPFRAVAEVAATPSEVFDRCEAVLLAVPGETEIDDLLGRSGAHIRAPVCDTVVINACTVSPDYSSGLAAAIEERGGHYVEAPLSGSRKPAEAGSLIVLAAACDGALIDRVQPLFEAIGKGTLRCGTPPGAMRMKLANNLLLISLLLGFAQAFTFARALGVDPQRFAELVSIGPMANDVFRVKIGKLLDGDFAAEASITNVHKDTQLIRTEADRHRIYAPYAVANASLLAEAIEDGWGDDDIIGVARLLERATAAGLSI